MALTTDDIAAGEKHILLVYSGHTTTADIMIRFMLRFVINKSLMLKTKEAKDIRGMDIQWADTVLVVRGADYLLAKVCTAAHRAHRLCILYIDDDLLLLYKKGDIYHKALMECIRSADVLWTSNQNV